MTRLEDINADVFLLIAYELKGKRRALQKLSSCSRTIRDLVAPVLFARCKGGRKIPPPYIRRYARHLTHMGNVDCGPSLSNLERVLDSLPALTSIRFDEADRISCDAIKLCLARTTIKTLSFGPRATFTRVEPYSVDEFSTTSCISLTAFAYQMPLWREQLNKKRGKLGPRNLSEMYSREAACLAALVPALNATVRHLTLPMESAPITSMAEMAWPRLTDLSIYGRYLNQSQVDSLPLLLSSLHHLRRLSITICRDDTIGRAPILGPTTPDESVLSGLESLTVAHPDPMDAIFAVSTADLTRLSIRDWPRYYNGLGGGRRYEDELWDAPLLSPNECLAILKRMEMPLLSSLELVYMVDKADADNELLSYVTSSFPKLSHLEVHRYRADREEAVAHTHIAELLAAATSLRTVHLNLDFPDDHGPYCSEPSERKAWYPTFQQLGWEVVDVMQRCPLLEYVGLLYHGMPGTTWAEFHPPRCAEPRLVLQYDEAHRDSELLPYSDWYINRTINELGPDVPCTWRNTLIPWAWHSEQNSIHTPWGRSSTFARKAVYVSVTHASHKRSWGKTVGGQ
ncbi:hypothetical protein C8Q76DRAFT_799900 [Earliella scabrosa]|nr:hypothetical protein C8Q76DRAFT_799900 [Earliella scabrosa]